MSGVGRAETRGVKPTGREKTSLPVKAGIPWIDTAQGCFADGTGGNDGNRRRSASDPRLAAPTIEIDKSGIFVYFYYGDPLFKEVRH